MQPGLPTKIMMGSSVADAFSSTHVSENVATGVVSSGSARRSAWVRPTLKRLSSMKNSCVSWSARQPERSPSASISLSGLGSAAGVAGTILSTGDWSAWVNSFTRVSNVSSRPASST